MARQDSRPEGIERLLGKWTPEGLLRFARGGAGQAATLGQRQVYILPTRYGLLFAGMLLAMLIGSLNYGSNLGFLYTFLLAGIGLSTMLETWRNLLGLQVHGGRAEPVFAGQEAWFSIELGNPRRSQRPGIELGRRNQTPEFTDLPPLGRAQVRLRVPTERRGVVALGRLTLATRYPLGLLRAWGYVEIPLECVVYPRPAASGALPPAPGVGLDEQGELGRGSDDFAGLRQYRPGDPPKHVYWKAAARGGELLTKQFGGNRGETLWLDWSEVPGRDEEARLSLLCRWVLLASEAGIDYGLRLPGLEIGPENSEQQRSRCLGALARFGVAER
jgi:uncharacterized protein (DUF58 family)